MRSTPPLESHPLGDQGRSILFLTPIPPDDEGCGLARRASALVRALSQTADVRLLVLPQLPAGVLHRAAHRLARFSPGLWTAIARRPLGWNGLSAERLRLCRAAHPGHRFDLIYALRIASAEIALDLRRHRHRDARLVLDLDDIESLKHQRIASAHAAAGARAEALKVRREARIYARLERRLLPRFDRILVCSELDRARLADTHPAVRVLPNIAPLCSIPPGHRRPDAPFRFFFIGNLAYAPNTDALATLVRHIWPALRARLGPDSRLRIVGGSAPPNLEHEARAQPGVEWLGHVPRSSDAFADAHVLLVPLRSGGGTRIKILEAFASGCPVITTAIGIEGIEARPGVHHLLAETIEDFVREALRLKNDPALRNALARQARALIDSHYSPAALAATVRTAIW